MNPVMSMKKLSSLHFQFVQQQPEENCDLISRKVCTPTMKVVPSMEPMTKVGSLYSAKLSDPACTSTHHKDDDFTCLSEPIMQDFGAVFRWIHNSSNDVA